MALDALERRARNAGVVEQRAAGAHLCSGHVRSDAHLLAAQIRLLEIFAHVQTSFVRVRIILEL